jgi:MFS family permease
MQKPTQSFDTDVPARLDRLGWSRFHTLVVAALGITWILDGLEVTLVGSLAGALAGRDGLGLGAGEIGFAASAYIGGAVLGALLFGYLTDRLGRRRLFFVTVGLYLAATCLTGLAWDFRSFCVLRFLTGMGIGGEYGAVNSAIQEMIPAHYRGRTDLMVNGSFWIGAALGALGSVVVLDPALFAPSVGWRVAFLIGGVLGIGVVWLRRFIPESPRWLMIHGRAAEAERIVAGIEAAAGAAPPAQPLARLALHRRGPARLGEVAATLFARYPRRTLLCVVLMASQAFCYNAIFFTYALVLARFNGVAPGQVGWFILPFALGNFLGPLTLGHLFDRIGRRRMIAASYGLAGLLMLATGALFAAALLDAGELTACWTVIFFFASAAASAAYLTAGECFPLEMRAIAVALFYAFGTALGGIAGPAIFGALIETGSRGEIFAGYGLGGILMLIAALAAHWLALPAERQPLESVAPPLSQGY